MRFSVKRLGRVAGSRGLRRDLHPARGGGSIVTERLVEYTYMLICLTSKNVRKDRKECGQVHGITFPIPQITIVWMHECVSDNTRWHWI